MNEFPKFPFSNFPDLKFEISKFLGKFRLQGFCRDNGEGSEILGIFNWFGDKFNNYFCLSGKFTVMGIH